MTGTFPILLTLLLLTAAGLAAICWMGRNTRHVLDLPILFLSGALALPSCTALILADLNLFSIHTVWGIVLLLLVTGGLLHRKDLSFAANKQTFLILAGLVLLLTLLFSRPFEYLYGGWDPGEYVSTASHFTRTGGIDYHEPFLTDLPQDLEPRFFRTWAPPRSTLHAGYLVVDADTGHMVPDYFHLYPAWLALFVSHGSYETAYSGQTVLAVISTLLFLLVIARMTSVRIGALTALFFLTQPAVLYFARFTSSEFLSLGLLFAILGVWKQQDESSDVPRTLWIGLLVYGAVTCHITNLLPLAGMGMMGALLGWRPLLHSPGRDLLSLAVATGLGVLRGFIAQPVFSEHLFKQYVIEAPEKVVAVLLIPLVLGSLGWAVWKAVGSNVLASRRMNHLIRWAPAVLILLAALYQYVLRPRWTEDRNAINLQSLGWVVSPTGLLLSLAACFTFNWRKTSRTLLLFLAAAGLSAAVLIHNKNVQPVYFWAFRRYIPMTLPLLAFLMSWSLDQAVRLKCRTWAAPLLGLLGLFSLGWQLKASLPVFSVREHHGLPTFVTDVAESMKDAEFILVDHWKLATPLRHAVGLPAYSLTQEPRPVEQSQQILLHAFIRNRAEKQSPAYYLTHDSAFAIPGLQVLPITTITHEAELLEWRRNSLPREKVASTATAHLYQLIPSSAPYDPAQGPIELKVGYHSLGLLRGFYEHTHSRGRSYRWTDGMAQLFLPAFSQPSTLTLSLAHMRPDSLGTTVEVTLKLDGEPLTTLTLGPGWTEHQVDLPTGTSPTFTLSLITDTWSPADFEISGYPDKLGIRVESVRVDPKIPEA